MTAPSAPTRSRASVIAYLAFLGALLAAGIDIALPAFDAIEDGLQPESSVSLVVTVYFVGMALGQLVAGPIADRYGRRPAILSGLILYVVGAAASALAPSFEVLLLARLVWGLGAAAPAGLRPAIARDLYKGDEMARVTTIIMAVFMLGPIFVPLVGEVLINIAPWPVVFWFAAALAAIAVVWCVRFGETLAPEHKRPLELGKLGQALAAVARTRVTLGHLVANTFFSGAFFIFLGSSQPVFDQVFDRSSQFAVLFALSGLCTIPALLVNNRLIDRFGARRMSFAAASGSTMLAALALIPTFATGGQPPFWTWYVWLVIATGLLTVATPAFTALALEPMGELAGTASSLMYFTSFAFGAGLAAIFDLQVGDTITPFMIGFALYTAIGLGFLAWAGPRLRSA